MEDVDPSTGDFLDVYLYAVRSLVDSRVSDSVDEELTDTQMEDHIITMSPLISKLETVLQKLQDNWHLCETQSQYEIERLTDEIQGQEQDMEQLAQRKEEQCRVLTEQENLSTELAKRISSKQIHNFQSAKRLSVLKASLEDEEKIREEQSELTSLRQALNEEKCNTQRIEREIKQIEEQQSNYLKELEKVLSDLQSEQQMQEARLNGLKEVQNKHSIKNDLTSETISSLGQQFNHLKKQNIGLQDQRDQLVSQIEQELNSNEPLQPQCNPVQNNNHFHQVQITFPNLRTNNLRISYYKKQRFQSLSQTNNHTTTNYSSCSSAIQLDQSNQLEQQSEILKNNPNINNSHIKEKKLCFSTADNYLKDTNFQEEFENDNPSQKMINHHPNLVWSLKEEAGEIFSFSEFSPTSSTVEFLRDHNSSLDQQLVQFPIQKSPIIQIFNSNKHPTKNLKSQINMQEQERTPLSQICLDNEEEEEKNLPWGKASEVVDELNSNNCQNHKQLFRSVRHSRKSTNSGSQSSNPSSSQYNHLDNLVTSSIALYNSNKIAKNMFNNSQKDILTQQINKNTHNSPQFTNTNQHLLNNLSINSTINLNSRENREFPDKLESAEKKLSCLQAKQLCQKIFSRLPICPLKSFSKIS